MNPSPSCDMCGRPVPCGSGYLVQIEVFADPQLPPMTSEQIATTDVSGTLAGLMNDIQNMSAEELQDGVHRRFEFHLCPRCHKSYLANPLGMPRSSPISTN